MKLFSIFFLMGHFAYGINQSPNIRELYLKAMQEPTGKNFQLFQKSCKAGNEKLRFTEDPQLLETLKPKKRHLGTQVHILLLSYKYCTEDTSKEFLEKTFAVETLSKNLKKFISVTCKEMFSNEEVKKILNYPNIAIDKLSKRLKAITIPTKCSDYKTLIEKHLTEKQSTQEHH